MSTDPNDLVTQEEVEATLARWREKGREAGVVVPMKFVLELQDRVGKPRDWRPPPKPCRECGR